MDDALKDRRGGTVKWIGMGVVLGLVILAVVLFFMERGSAPSYGGAIGTTLDPRLYLPEGAEKGDFMVTSVNVKAVMQIGVVGTILGEPVIQGRLREIPIVLSPKDWEEVVVVMVGNLSHAPSVYTWIRTTGDDPISAMSQSGNPLEKSGKAGGFEIFTPRSMRTADHAVVKVGPSLFLVTSNVAVGELAGYLAKAGKRTATEYPEGAEEMRRKVGDGIAVVYGTWTYLGGKSAETLADTSMYFAARMGSDVAAEWKADDAKAAELEEAYRKQLADLKTTVQIVRDGGNLRMGMSMDALAAGGALDQWIKKTLEGAVATRPR